jgi:Alkylmercury lyase
MLAFRSEAHVDRWCTARRIPRGAFLTLEQAWQLGRAWSADKLSPDWRRATPAEAEATFASIGLTGAFWQFG